MRFASRGTDGGLVALVVTSFVGLLLHSLLLT
jgi:hypothetical protein